MFEGLPGLTENEMRESIDLCKVDAGGSLVEIRGQEKDDGKFWTGV